MIGEGKTRGQAAILETDASTNQNVAGLVFDAGNVCSDYVWYWALSEYEKNRAVGRGGAQPALNGEKVRALTLPLPPLEEQREIVRRIEGLFRLAEAVEARLSSTTRRAGQLTQSILAKAFRGELVPTEAELARREGREYEPASVLLERIRSERANHAQTSASPKRRLRKSSAHV
jgi:type I restriction enzyme S subunit